MGIAKTMVRDGDGCPEAKRWSDPPPNEKPLDQRNKFGTRTAALPDSDDRSNNEQRWMRKHWTSEIFWARKILAIRTPEIGATTNIRR
jgi:hypothetical protein